MDSIRRALRQGDVTKDVYERLACADCDEQLLTENDPDAVGSVRVCPECDKQWQQLP